MARPQCCVPNLGHGRMRWQRMFGPPRERTHLFVQATYILTTQRPARILPYHNRGLNCFAIRHCIKTLLCTLRYTKAPEYIPASQSVPRNYVLHAKGFLAGRFVGVVMSTRHGNPEGFQPTKRVRCSQPRNHDELINSPHSHLY